MSEDIIKIENLSKLYRLGEIGTGTLGHDLNRWWAKIRGKEDPFSQVGETNDRTKIAESDYVWALKDINLEIKQGEILGIIGKNGAGKSTLLKLISRITSPTTGLIKINGSTASLLEVGTGMHSEMTARENIFLNGAILGMKKKEIIQKFDEIIDFSGCTRYVDTPVKRYSSGMRVRLGFAVAAFLEPEILIVDEVLAVGDAEFQKKCMGKLKNFNQNGRTILFVSHNMSVMSSLCQKGLIIENGEIVHIGDMDICINQYINQFSNNRHNSDLTNVSYRDGNGKLRFTSIQIVDDNGVEIKSPTTGNNYCFKVGFEAMESIKGVRFILKVKNNLDRCYFVLSNIWKREHFALNKGNGICNFKIDKLPLPIGEYVVELIAKSMFRGELFDKLLSAYSFNVEVDHYFGYGVPSGQNNGVYVEHEVWID